MLTFTELVGSRWSGRSELWLDPQGNQADEAACTIAIDADAVRYTWIYEGQPQTGTLKLHVPRSEASGADFSDSWHSKEVMPCAHVPGLPGLLNVAGTYLVEWGWRIHLSHRTPTGELVLQMTNVTPWGEESRAVRMICKRDDG